MEFINQKILSGISIEIPNSAKPGGESHIIYREIEYNTKNSRFHYSRIDRKVDWNVIKNKIPGVTNINELLLNIDKYKAKQILTDPEEPGTGLGIPVRQKSHVILAIAGNFPWTFGADLTDRAVSLGRLAKQGYKDKFSDVLHLNSGSVDSTVKPGCRLVAFSVDALEAPDPMGGQYEQPINFHMVDAGGTPITVDPDIRYPGNYGLEEGDPLPFVTPEGEPTP